MNGTGNNWLAVSLYSGSLQIAGAMVLLYGEFVHLLCRVASFNLKSCLC